MAVDNITVKDPYLNKYWLKAQDEIEHMLEDPNVNIEDLLARFHSLERVNTHQNNQIYQTLRARVRELERAAQAEQVGKMYGGWAFYTMIGVAAVGATANIVAGGGINGVSDVAGRTASATEFLRTPSDTLYNASKEEIAMKVRQHTEESEKIKGINDLYNNKVTELGQKGSSLEDNRHAGAKDMTRV